MKLKKFGKQCKKEIQNFPKRHLKYYAKLFKKDYIEFNLKKYYEKLIETK